MKNRMLYLMHIHWKWAKQRPQFLAEELSDYFDIRVYYPVAYRQKQINKKENSVVFAKPFFKLPFDKKLKVIGKMNSYLVFFQVRKALKESEIIWFTYPREFFYLRNFIKANQIVIYDCMDDILSFPAIENNGEMKNKYFSIEKELIERSNHIFFSSNYLHEKVTRRYNSGNKSNLVLNNAISLNAISMAKESLPSILLDEVKRSNKIKLVYIGTISKWLDFKLIFESLSAFDNIEYYLIGPTEIAIPVHDRVKYLGTVPHKYVFGLMDFADILVMPFVMNELILSVNPVKLYEYVFSGKPVVSIKYGETLKFDNYVYLYSNNEEYLMYLHDLHIQLKPKRSRGECEDFARKNTWKERGNKIIELVG